MCIRIRNSAHLGIFCRLSFHWNDCPWAWSSAPSWLKIFKNLARTNETHEKKKKRWQLEMNPFSISSWKWRFGEDEVGLQGSSTGCAKASRRLCLQVRRHWYAGGGSSTPWPRGRADCFRFAIPAEATSDRRFKWLLLLLFALFRLLRALMVLYDRSLICLLTFASACNLLACFCVC